MGDLAKGILLTWLVFWIFAIIWYFATGQLGMALLFTVGFLIPLSFTLYDYWMHKRK